MIKKKICIYCSSSDAVDNKYFELAQRTAKLMVEKNYDLVYGGANVGIMRSIAENVKIAGGKVIGVMPERIHSKGLGFKDSDDFFVTKDMHERKAKMAELADAFIALPGGFGTIEELVEVITHKQLNYHTKPIVIINYDNFYSNLVNLFEDFYIHKFSKEVYRKLYYIADNEISAIEYIENYEPIVLDNKWFDVSKTEFK